MSRPNLALLAADNEEPLADAVFRSLLAQIYDGRLVAGALLNEAALADEYRTSRGPVREAIRRLQGYKLVTREPYQRARIVQLTPDFVRQLFEMRMALEGMACNLAAQRIASEDLDGIAHALEQYRMRSVMPLRKGADPRVFDFHESIARACGNERIAESLCGDLYHLLRIYRKRASAAPDRRRQAYEEHWQILRALRARDGQLAESLMRAHIGRANDALAHVESTANVRA